MIFLIAYASSILVAFPIILVYLFRTDEMSRDDWSIAAMGACMLSVVWPGTLTVIGCHYIASRPPACACGLRGRKGGKFCGRCGSKIGANSLAQGRAK